MYRLFTARENLIISWVSTTSQFDPSFICPQSEPNLKGTPNCPSNKEKTGNKQVHKRSLFDKWMYDPIFGLEVLIKIDWGKYGWCEDCVQMRIDAWERMRTRLWTTSEIWLDLPHEVEIE
ncbi:hypothetical protein BJ138DRAFT_377724 [Hygrophoropsis aurantiaca]|uniref:Uncharacterized protein n=1 Tax=Hygrophoropsis aurantiaca TaxID=72124 RepID=A0ACB8A5D2_9AGAM|nr:hypothetical protein BJ138DRAFT_377724 [Hygrophoropsis aurantiaca]